MSHHNVQGRRVTARGPKLGRHTSNLNHIRLMQHNHIRKSGLVSQQIGERSWTSAAANGERKGVGDGKSSYYFRSSVISSAARRNQAIVRFR